MPIAEDGQSSETPWGSGERDTGPKGINLPGLPRAEPGLWDTGLGWFLLLYFLLNVGMGVFPPLLPQIMESLDISFAAVGLLGSAYAVTRFVMNLPAGLLVERLGFAQVLHAGMGLLVLGSALSAWSPTYAVLLASRGLLGMATGMANITAILYLMRSGPPSLRSRRANLYELAVVAGMAVSADLGGVVGGRWGWRWSFGLAVLVLVAAWAVAAQRVLPALMSIELPPPPRDVSARGRRRLPPGPILAIYVAMFTQAFAWGGGISTLLPLYGGRALDLSPSAIGRTMALAFWVEVCLLFPVGWAADAWGKTRILLPGFLAILLGTLLVPATGGILGYGAAFVLLTAGMSGWMLVPAILTERLGGDFGGRSAAFYRLVTDLGFILAPATVGWLIGRVGFHAAAGAIGIVVASSLLLSFRFLSRAGDG